jgi:hypothetical protein
MPEGTANAPTTNVIVPAKAPTKINAAMVHAALNARFSAAEKYLLTSEQSRYIVIVRTIKVQTIHGGQNVQ